MNEIKGAPQRVPFFYYTGGTSEIKSRKPCFRFCTSLGFHFLYRRQDAVRHNQIEKLIFHLLLRSPFAIFARDMVKEIISLLPPRAKRRSGWVAVAVLIRALLDFAGVAALIPLLLAVLRPEGNRAQMLLLCTAVMGFVIGKNAMVVALARVESNFQLEVYRDFSRRMFINYYHRGLLFLKSKSSVQLGHEVNYVCYLFCLCVLSPLFRIAGDAILILFMMLTLVIWEPVAGLLLCMAFLPLALVYTIVVRRRLRLYGQEELEARRKQSRTVVEAFRGYAELEIAQAFDTLLSTFDQGMESIVRSRQRMERYQLFPQFLSEAAIVMGIALLIGAGRGDLSIVSGVFAIAAFRLIPAMRSILNSWVTLQNASHSIHIVKDGLDENREPEEEPEKPFAFEKKLELRNLGFAFPDGKLLFSGVNLTIHRGERIGVRGPSGSGKSTLFNLLLGFLEPTEGEIRVDGRKLTPANRHGWHRLVGYVPQEIFIIEGSLLDNVALGDAHPDRQRVMEVLTQVSLKDWTAELPQGLDTPLGEYGSRLSGGQKQRIGIARALYKKAEVLFFDEATSALDSRTESEINQALEELSEQYHELTLIIIAHRESSLKVCDRIFDLS